MASQPPLNRWWQWILVYPLLLTSIVASIPTYVELYRSKKFDVRYGESTNAATRNDLWRKNLACAAAPFDWLVTPNNVQIDATICKSGDVLVRGQSPDSRTFYEWVALERLTSSSASLGFSFIDSALAAESGRIILAQPQPMMVMCQRWIGNGRLLRRINVQGRGCFDEVINTYNGYVESSRPAPCNPGC